MSLVFLSSLWRREPWRRSDGVAGILSPDSAVELDVGLFDLSVVAEDEDVEALDGDGAGEQGETPAPGDRGAGVPDVQRLDLVDPGTAMSVADLDGLEVGLCDLSVGCAGEEVDAVGDLLLVGVGDGFEEGVEGGCVVAVGHFGLSEGGDEICGLVVGQAAARTPAAVLPPRSLGWCSGDGCSCREREED